MPTDLSSDSERDGMSDGSPGRPPKLSDILSLRDIAVHVAQTAFSRGKTYQSQHRVSNLVMSPDLRSITAEVRGGSEEPYQQNIQLSINKDTRTHIRGACTCPMGHNCKHVAAALIEALTVENSSRVSPPPAKQLAFLPEAEPPPPPAPALPYDIAAWLEQLTFTVSGDEYPANVNQRLVYIFTAHAPLNAAPQLAVEVVTARLLKSGEFSNSVTRPSLSNFYASGAPRYFRASDVEIVQALLAERSSYNYRYHIVKPFALISSIVATGRARWQNPDAPRLQMGDPRTGELEWIMPDARGMRPVLRVENGIALNAEPPVYIDVQQGLIGEITLPIAAKLAHRLLSAPAIAPAHIEQVRETLGRHLPEGTNLCPKAPEPPVSVDTAPVPVLHLLSLGIEGSRWPPGGMDSTIAAARLAFRYGPVEVAYGEVQGVVDVLKNNRRYQVRRRIAQEKRAAALLFNLGLRLLREVQYSVNPAQAHYLAFADPIQWLDFLSREAARLQAEGFEITIDDEFPYRLAQPTGDIDAEVFESTRTDWFELGMGIQVDGQTLDLAPLLANLVLIDGLDPASVKALAEEGEDIYVPLDDGRHLALAAKRFLPVIIALHELSVGGTVVAENGRLKISKAEAALLSGLEGQEGIVFKGIENLRRLSRALASVGTGKIPGVSLPDSFKAILRPYQSEGVGWLNLLREVGLGGILADDMGLGKTVQILALLTLEKAEGRLQKPVLIIAPTSLMTNWQNEAAKFAPGLNLLLLHGPERKERFDEIPKRDIVLTTYPLIARDQVVLLEQEWHMAILDEAQVIKNPNAATTKLIRDLKAGHRFCLTGTPMENHLGELWSLMTFVNPGYLGDKSAFARRWRTPIEKYGDTDRAQVLARRVKAFMLRRTKQEVASELPPKTEITESILLDDSQRDIYDSIRLSMHKKVRQAIAAKGLAKSHIIILEALLKLRQVCCDPRLLKLSSSNGRDKSPPSAKLERLMQMLEELLSEGRKIIVFSQFTSMLALIAERFQQAGIAFSLLTGETLDRKSAIENFQSGLVDTFLVSLKAGGVGLNLTAADTVILYDPWWNPAVEEQAIDRAYRIGQDKPVFVYRLVASQTIEEKMDELKAKKRALAAGLFGQANDSVTTLTEEELNNLFEM